MDIHAFYEYTYFQKKGHGYWCILWVGLIFKKNWTWIFIASVNIHINTHENHNDRMDIHMGLRSGFPCDDRRESVVTAVEGIYGWEWNGSTLRNTAKQWVQKCIHLFVSVCPSGFISFPLTLFQRLNEWNLQRLKKFLRFLRIINLNCQLMLDCMLLEFTVQHCFCNCFQICAQYSIVKKAEN